MAIETNVWRIWREEVGCYDGGTAYVNQTGIFVSECDDDGCPYAERERDKCKTIKAVWRGRLGYAWHYETLIPHETFDVYGDGEKFCRGIVFSMDSFKKSPPPGSGEELVHGIIYAYV